MGKGGDFERDVAKFLTKWLTGKPKPYMFWRMPASGGLATIHEECVGLAGDIRSVHKDAEFFTSIFAVECKNGYPRTSFWQHFKEIKNFNIEHFWLQTLNEAKSADKLPMLIYRKKGNKPFIGVNSGTVIELEQISNITELPRIDITWPVSKDIDTLFSYDFEKFFGIVEPDDIKEVGRQLTEWQL